MKTSNVSRENKSLSHKLSMKHVTAVQSEVYNPKEKPWIKPENATSEELIAQVAKCPSGALSIKS